MAGVGIDEDEDEVGCSEEVRRRRPVNESIIYLEEDNLKEEKHSHN